MAIFNLLRQRLLTIVFLLLLIFTVSLISAEEKKYPPYPDMWGIELPVSNTVTYAGIDVVKMSDGDFMAVYIQDKVKIDGKKKNKYVGKRLFSGMAKEFTIDEYNTFFEKMCKEGREMKNLPLTFSDGSKMEFRNDICGGTWGDAENPFDWCLERKDKNGKVLLQKKLLYLYDKPVKKDTPMRERNFDYKGKYYYEKVNWPDEMRYVPLEDDTFLIIGFLQYQNPPSIVIVRFDKDFKTKSDLLSKKIFLVDEKIYRNQPLLNDQAANNFFYNHLIKLRKEK